MGAQCVGAASSVSSTRWACPREAGRAWPLVSAWRVTVEAWREEEDQEGGLMLMLVMSMC